MALTPEMETSEILLDNDLPETMYASLTYNMELENGRIRGYSDGLESMKQVIYKIVRTERSVYPVYSDNYGIELEDLFGEPISYVIPELERRITEALTWDSRIESVDNFEFEVTDHKVHCTFTVSTIFGEIDEERVIEI